MAHSVSPTATAVGAGLVTLGLLAALQIAVSEPKLLLLERFVPGLGWLEVVLLPLYAAWLARKLSGVRAVRRVRPLVWRLFSLVFFFQLALGLMGFSVFLMTGKLHLPVPALIVAGPVYRGSGFFMLILFGVTLLFVGPAWCSWLCYIGSWDDLAARRQRLPGPPPPGRTTARILLLGMVVLTALGLRLCGVEQTAAALAGVAFGVLGVGVMVAFSRRRGIMVHCTVWCPIGLVADLAGKLSPFRLRIGAGCDACLNCEKSCRYGALTWKDIQRKKPGLTCTLCGDCLSYCHAGQIHYHFPGLAPAAARSIFLVLTVSFHAVFIAVARI